MCSGQASRAAVKAAVQAAVSATTELAPPQETTETPLSERLTTFLTQLRSRSEAAISGGLHQIKSTWNGREKGQTPPASAPPPAAGVSDQKEAAEEKKEEEGEDREQRIDTAGGSEDDEGDEGEEEEEEEETEGDDDLVVAMPAPVREEGESAKSSTTPSSSLFPDLSLTAENVQYGSERVIDGVKRSAQALGTGVRTGTKYLQERLPETDKPVVLSAETKDRIHQARLVSEKIRAGSSAIASGVGKGVASVGMKVGKTVAGRHFRNATGSGNGVLSQSATAALNIYDALEQAGITLLGDVTAGTGELVSARYGPDMGSLVHEGLLIGTNLLLAGVALRSIHKSQGFRSTIQRAAAGAAATAISHVVVEQINQYTDQQQQQQHGATEGKQGEEPSTVRLMLDSVDDLQETDEELHREVEQIVAEAVRYAQEKAATGDDGELEAEAEAADGEGRTRSSGNDDPELLAAIHQNSSALAALPPGRGENGEAAIPTLTQVELDRIVEDAIAEMSTSLNAAHAVQQQQQQQRSRQIEGSQEPSSLLREGEATISPPESVVEASSTEEDEEGNSEGDEDDEGEAEDIAVALPVSRPPNPSAVEEEQKKQPGEEDRVHHRDSSLAPSPEDKPLLLPKPQLKPKPTVPGQESSAPVDRDAKSITGGGGGKSGPPRMSRIVRSVMLGVSTMGSAMKQRRKQFTVGKSKSDGHAAAAAAAAAAEEEGHDDDVGDGDDSLVAAMPVQPQVLPEKPSLPEKRRRMKAIPVNRLPSVEPQLEAAGAEAAGVEASAPIVRLECEVAEDGTVDVKFFF